MTKQRAIDLSTELEAILLKFAEKNDLNLKYKGSSYSEAVAAAWKPKFEFNDTSEIAEDSSFAEENFKNLANRTFGKIKPEWFNMSVKLHNGEIGYLKEYHPRKSKYPMIVITESGSRYKLPLNMILANVQ